jgi:elongation factor Ts
MPEISAKQVQALRARTDLAMMDCKAALVEAAGDEAKALDILRRKFADKMSARSDKEAANGRIGVHACGKCAALAEIRCETDFVATNDAFRSLADAVADACASSGMTDVEKLKDVKTKSGRTVGELFVDAFGKLKENMNVQRAARIEGAGASYVHHNGKVGAVIACDKEPGEPGRQICMHIASNVMLRGLNRSDVKPDEVAAAQEKAREEAKGKPPQIIDKIVAGKMDKWYAERVLTEQPFVIDDKKTVGEFAKENGFTIKAYLKYEVGGLG